MRDNPSLKAALDEVMVDAYRLARRDAERESGIAESVFPERPPWTVEQLMDDELFPD